MFGAIIQEFKMLMRNRFSTVLTLFGIPILYTLLFGSLYSVNVVKNIPLIVCDQDQTALSRTLIQCFADSERYNIVAQVTSQEEVEQYLHNNKAMAAVFISPDFSRNIKQSRAADALIEINAANLMFANGVLASSQEIVQTFSVGVGQKLIEGINQPPTQALKTVMPVKMGLRILDNPTGSYSNFIMPGLSINGLQLAIFLVACTLLTTESTNLVAQQELSSWAIIVVKLLPCWFLSILSGMVSIGILVFYFKLPFHGNLVHLLVINSAFTFAISNLGLFLSAISSNILATMQYVAIYIMSSFLCSGYSWPNFAMNQFGQVYAALLPITYAAGTVRDILLSSYAPNLLYNTFILFAIGSMCLLLAVVSFAKRRKQVETMCREDAL